MTRLEGIRPLLQACSPSLSFARTFLTGDVEEAGSSSEDLPGDYL